MTTQQVGRRPGGTTTPSPRALQILDLLAAGHTKADIGRQLYITESTVKTHVHAAFSLLHARTVAQAVGIAIGEGLIPAPRRADDVAAAVSGTANWR